MPIDNYKKIKVLKKNFLNLNIKILISKKKHQVHQRIQGFKIAKYKYIMQLDDDVKIANDCLFKLFLLLKENKYRCCSKIY